MSHVASVDVHIKDLASLKAACAALGLELVEGQQTYRWYGRHVGDYPLPAGYSVQDLGKCVHAIRIPGDSRAYEIGVVQRKDGKPGFSLMWDFWQGGYGLEALVGKDCQRLKQQYAAKVATKQAKAQGFRVYEKQTADGKIQLVCRR